jgi:hypothetical protein
MSVGEIEQSRTTPGVGTPARDAALNLLKADVTKLVTALEGLVAELAAIGARLDRIEKLMNEIAVGLGVAPK